MVDNIGRARWDCVMCRQSSRKRREDRGARRQDARSGPAGLHLQLGRSRSQEQDVVAERSQRRDDCRHRPRRDPNPRHCGLRRVLLLEM